MDFLNQERQQSDAVGVLGLPIETGAGILSVVECVTINEHRIFRCGENQVCLDPDLILNGKDDVQNGVFSLISADGGVIPYKSRVYYLGSEYIHSIVTLSVRIALEKVLPFARMFGRFTLIEEAEERLLKERLLEVLLGDVDVQDEGAEARGRAAIAVDRKNVRAWRLYVWALIKSGGIDKWTWALQEAADALDQEYDEAYRMLLKDAPDWIRNAVG